MHSPSELQHTIEQELKMLRLDHAPSTLYDPIRYSLSIGGKRMRPILVLLGCELAGGRASDAMGPALGIEIFHNFTLVHDDIMDNAPLRRGSMTVYRKWDVNTAILSGDTMFALAYEYMAKVAPPLLPAVLAVFTNTAREVCEGQQYDMDFESRNDVSLEEYLSMIRLKTAVLLGCSLEIGALAAGAAEELASGIYHFGENLGMAFQIRDDYLDSFGDEAVFGKQTGGDILANKKTFLYISALERLKTSSLEELKDLYSRTDFDPAAKITRVKALFTEAGIPELCEESTGRYFDRAMAILSGLRIAEDRKAVLHDFALRLMQRDA